MLSLFNFFSLRQKTADIWHNIENILRDGSPEQRNDLIQEIENQRILATAILWAARPLLSEAISCSNDFRADFVPLLLRHGADPNFKIIYEAGRYTSRLEVDLIYDYKSSRSPNISLSRLLLSYGLDLDNVLEKSKTTLLYQSMREISGDYFNTFEALQRADNCYHNKRYLDAIEEYESVIRDFEQYIEIEKTPGDLDIYAQKCVEDYEIRASACYDKLHDCHAHLEGSNEESLPMLPLQSQNKIKLF
ncbi:MAG: hypothetical protein ACE365_00400 [Gammaproteobacteria bacterium]